MGENNIRYSEKQINSKTAMLLMRIEIVEDDFGFNISENIWFKTKIFYIT